VLARFSYNDVNSRYNLILFDVVRHDELTDIDNHTDNRIFLCVMIFFHFCPVDVYEI